MSARRNNADEEVQVSPKKFITVPRDAFDCLLRRHGSFDAAVSAAQDACAEDGMTLYVLELKACVARADRPVTVKKL